MKRLTSMVLALLMLVGMALAEETPEADPALGDWYVLNVDGTTECLTLREDGTFCYGSREGTWRKMTDGEYWLTFSRNGLLDVMASMVNSQIAEQDLTALLTEGFFFSLIISIFAVLSVDYIFTPPYWNVSFTLSGFPLTFLVTMTISVVTGIVTSRAKQMDEVRREAELERMHGNLLRAVSHDIRTPLTGIVGATNVLLEQENTLTPEQRHELIRNANEEAQWLIRIVENLLSITRMGGDEAKVNKTPEAAEEIIEGAVGKFTRRWGTDIPVEVHLPEEFLLVPMDPLLMEQVLTNLMENAVLHGKTTRHITVTLCRSGDWARFIVEDDGQGIAPDRLEHLFDGTLQGQQGDRGRSMGIGLSVCRTVVQAHGGRIRGENRTEGGARFTVELPLDKEIQQEVDSYEDQG